MRLFHPYAGAGLIQALKRGVPTTQQSKSIRLTSQLTANVGRGSRRRIGRGLADLPERVAIRVVERLRLTGNYQNRVLLVGPGSVGMDRHGDGVTHGAERVLEKWVGTDPVRLGTTDRFEAE